MEWNWILYFQDSSLTWLLAGGLSFLWAVDKKPWFLTTWTSPITLPECPHDEKITSYGESNLTERGQGGSHEVFMTNFQKSHTSATFYVLEVIHADVWQKPTQYCKAIILQLKINELKKRVSH